MTNTKTYELYMELASSTHSMRPIDFCVCVCGWVHINPRIHQVHVPSRIHTSSALNVNGFGSGWAFASALKPNLFRLRDSLLMPSIRCCVSEEFNALDTVFQRCHDPHNPLICVLYISAPAPDSYIHF